MKPEKLIKIICAFVVLLALLMTGCGSDDSETAENNDSASASTDTVTDVSLVSRIDNNNAYATIIGTDENGDVIWTVKTDGFPATELPAFTDLGIYEDQYFYIESGTVVSLDVQTGNVNWKNADFGGSPSQYCHIIDSSNGNIFLSGYYGPDFYAVDKNGKTLKRIQTVDSRYWWPVSLSVNGDDVTIRMDASSDGEQEHEVSFRMSDY